MTAIPLTFFFCLLVSVLSGLALLLVAFMALALGLALCALPLGFPLGLCGLALCASLGLGPCGLAYPLGLGFLTAAGSASPEVVDPQDDDVSVSSSATGFSPESPKLNVDSWESYKGTFP